MGRPEHFSANFIDFLWKIHKPLFALAAVGVGVAIGQATLGSSDFVALLCSILVIGLYMLITLHAPLNGFLVWIFFTTFIDSWIEVPLGAGIPDLSFGRFAVAFLAVALLMRASSGRFPRLHFGWIDLSVLLVPLGIALSAPLAATPIDVLQRAVTLHFIPVAGFFFARHLVRTQQDLDRLLWVIAGFGVIAGTYALFEGLTGHVFFVAKEQEIGRLYRGDTNLRLIVGLVGSTGAMARVLVTTLLVTIFLILENKISLVRAAWLAGAALEFGGLAITLSRTPILAFLVGLLILQTFYRSLRAILVVLAIVVAIGLGATWDRVQQSEVAQDRLTRVEDYNGRSPRWQAGVAMWLERPWRGWGIGRFEEQSGDYRTDGSNRNLVAVENDYLYILVGAGLIGFLPYALFLLLPALSSVQLPLRSTARNPDTVIRRGTIGLYWAVMGCFLITSFTAANLQSIIKLLPFVLAGAVVGSQLDLLGGVKRAAVAGPTEAVALAVPTRGT